MRPSSLPKELKLRRDDNRKISRQNNPSESKVCPYGTVPFKRVTKEDLIRAKVAFQHAPNPHYAGVTTPNDPSKQLWGAATDISVYNITDQKGQYSQALLWVGTSINGPYNSIEYGWTVNEGLYGDGLSRTYSLWTSDGLQNAGCYNALCPGYVQVSQKRIMGEPNHPVTIPGEDVYSMEFQIFKDPNTSNWWLFENLGDVAHEPVGYWPKEILPKMSSFASVVQLGGKVSSPNDEPSPARMGSGVFMPDDFTRTCYASNIQFVNNNYEFYDPKDEKMLVVGDAPDTYKAAYLGDASKDHPGRGYTLVFGGPALR
ncbi:uncharacterized protein LOC110729458 [Chenopodium quinoa]|nr:uncharacterized protein LOC110729458 [Chenopodium quinoa]